jgi:hypothetical protein
VTTRTEARAGILCGLVAVALLMTQARTPLYAISAVIAPLAGGAIAAIAATRREGHELEVEESAGIGMRTGLIGGFVVAVPFPLALHLAVPGTPLAGMAMTIVLAATVLLAYVALSLVAAVIAARIYGSRV